MVLESLSLFQVLSGGDRLHFIMAVWMRAMLSFLLESRYHLQLLVATFIPEVCHEFLEPTFGS